MAASYEKAGMLLLVRSTWPENPKAVNVAVAEWISALRNDPATATVIGKSWVEQPSMLVLRGLMEAQPGFANDPQAVAQEFAVAMQLTAEADRANSAAAEAADLNVPEEVVTIARQHRERILETSEALSSVLGIETPATAGRPNVAVFGAGIAGLTAAHELAERGFRVKVYERRAADDDDQKAELGGMAASHKGEVGIEQTRQRAAVRRFPGYLGDLPAELPGEHGFRFFPAYYLHLWDMLQRIPVYDDAGEPTSATVYENVRRVTTQVTTTPADEPTLVFPRELPRSLPELMGSVHQLGSLGFEGRDLTLFLSRLACYMSTSPMRRGFALEHVSMLDYLVGADSEGEAKFEYSSAFRRQIENMPKVLAAFDAKWGDARTNLDTYLQLQLRMDRRDNKADGVLNGPTTDVWFEHWRTHLGRMGVTFAVEELVRLEPDGDEGILAKLATDGGGTKDAVPDDGTTFEYLVVALDAPAAELVSEGLAGVLGGTVVELQGFTRSSPEGTDSEFGFGPRGPDFIAAPQEQKRVPTVPDEIGNVGWDRWRTLAGVQFYFDTEIQIAHGHVYYTDSPWALSSINHHGLWEPRQTPLLDERNFVAIMSVDIGDWKAKVEIPGKGKRSALELTVSEIAAEVWRQISESLRRSADQRVSPLPRPIAFMLDRNLEVDPGTDKITKNHTPYLVPIKTDYPNRPGGFPWNPHQSSPSTSQIREYEDLEPPTVADHGGYHIHRNSLVYAGSWAKTFTRMTSMEAACESGRHAVNAIIDHYIMVRDPGDERSEDVGLNWAFPYGFVDQALSGPVRQPTRVGDYCYIFDIENREPAEFRPARNMDLVAFESRQPPACEVLLPPDLVSSSASVVGFGLDPMLRTNPFSIGHAQDFISQLQRARKFFEAIAAGPPPAVDPGSGDDGGQGGGGDDDEREEDQQGDGGAAVVASISSSGAGGGEYLIRLQEFLDKWQPGENIDLSGLDPSWREFNRRARAEGLGLPAFNPTVPFDPSVLEFVASSIESLPDDAPNAAIAAAIRRVMVEGGLGHPAEDERGGNL